jgi:4-hydroxybenzoate polyprenyltransferase
MTGRTLAYAQLLRLPNVFTAFGDILMAACAVGAITQDFGRVAVLMAASGCLYLGGMVWNDVFDRKDDAKTRPTRPIPSGRISVRTAVVIGSVLFMIGIVFAVVGRNPANAWGYADSALIATVLAFAILLYDALLKRTILGPLGMGLCRFLNVILGLSAAASAFAPEWGLHLAGVVGLYIVGVTWFARTEEGMSKPTHLLAAFGVMLVSLGLAITVPVHLPEGTVTPFYPYLVVAFGFWILGPIVTAVRQPTPRNVQLGVKRCILGLVLLDAVLATAFVGPPGLAIGLLLLPARWLGQWVYST